MGNRRWELALDRGTKVIDPSMPFRLSASAFPPFRLSTSVSRAAAVDVEGLAGDEAGGVGTEVNGGADEIVRGAETPHGNRGGDALSPFRVGQQVFGQACFGVGRTERIDRQSARRPFRGQ